MFSRTCKKIALIACAVLLTFQMAGCSKPSYPADKLKESLLQICRSEYGIEDLDVKIVGKTIGVFLPLKKLFNTDLKEALQSGKVKDMNALFEPSPEALDKVEDVLFSISRVILSTDHPLEFYILQATDVEKTALQIVLEGYVDDIKRVRVWDISRSEYRKRVIHELRLNQAVLWHKPVHGFLDNIQEQPASELCRQYFTKRTTPDILRHFFYDLVPGSSSEKSPVAWNVLDMRSIELDSRTAAVYVKVMPADGVEGLQEKDAALEYLFLVSLFRGESKIFRIIPFQYQDADGLVHKIEFPKELQIEENLSNWKEEFPVESIDMGTFLAQQLTRRVQAVLANDERIRNTFRRAQVEFSYVQDPLPQHFSVELDVDLKHAQYLLGKALMMHDDMIYLLTLASREFVNVIRSYRFGHYDYLSLNLAQDPTQWIFKRDELELFRRNKLNMQGLLTSFINI